MSQDSARSKEEESRVRKGLWNRLRGLGLLHEADLIRIHRIAQQQRVTPELAAIALGVVTQRQVLEG